MAALIADRKYKSPLPEADWVLSADDIVQVTLSLALHKHVPGWPGATDEQLFEIAKAVIDALDKTPRARWR